MARKTYGGILYGKQIKTPGETIPYELPPDNYILFGDPEGDQGRIGYSAAAGLGVGILGTGPADTYGLSYNPTTGDVQIRSGIQGYLYLENATGTTTLHGVAINQITAGTGNAFIQDSGVVFTGFQITTPGGAQIIANDATGIEIQSSAGSFLQFTDVPAPVVRIQAPALGAVYLTAGTTQISISGTLNRITMAANDVGLGAGSRLDCTGGVFTLPAAIPAAPQAGDFYYTIVGATIELHGYDGTNWRTVALA